MRAMILAAFLSAVPTVAFALDRCGYEPYSPYGCKLGPCVCDASGNCQWTFVCG